MNFKIYNTFYLKMYVKHCCDFYWIVVVSTIVSFILTCIFGGYIDISRPVLRNCTIYNYTKTHNGPIYLYDIIIVNDVKAEAFFFQANSQKEIEYYDNLISKTSFDCFYKNNGTTDLIFRKPKSYSKETAKNYAKIFGIIFASLSFILTILSLNCFTCFKNCDDGGCHYPSFENRMDANCIYYHKRIKNHNNKIFVIVYKRGVKLPKNGDVFDLKNKTNLVIYNDNFAFLNEDFKVVANAQQQPNYGSNSVAIRRDDDGQQSLLSSPPKITTVLKVQKHMMKAYVNTDCMICTDEMKEDEDIEAFIPCQHGIHTVCRNGIEKCPACGNV